MNKMEEIIKAVEEIKNSKLKIKRFKTDLGENLNRISTEILEQLLYNISYIEEIVYFLEENLDESDYDEVINKINDGLNRTYENLDIIFEKYSGKVLFYLRFKKYDSAHFYAPLVENKSRFLTACKSSLSFKMFESLYDKEKSSIYIFEQAELMYRNIMNSLININEKYIDEIEKIKEMALKILDKEIVDKIINDEIN